MSFLAGRAAAIEGAYFLQESKQAVTRLANKLTPKLDSSPLPPSGNSSKSFEKIGVQNPVVTADVLPEILKHNLPPNIYLSSSASVANSSSSSSFFHASKWVLQTDPKKITTSVSVDALHPLRGYVSLPQVTLGPKRWQLPNAEGSVLASTANELRQDKYTHVSSEKLQAATAGLSQIGKAFVCSTILVFGGAILTFEYLASQLDLHNSNDLQTKGRDFVHPRYEKVREQLNPLRTWAEDTAKKWHLEKKDTSLKENPLIKELSKTLGVKSSN